MWRQQKKDWQLDPCLLSSSSTTLYRQMRQQCVAASWPRRGAGDERMGLCGETKKKCIHPRERKETSPMCLDQATTEGAAACRVLRLFLFFFFLITLRRKNHTRRQQDNTQWWRRHIRQCKTKRIGNSVSPPLLSLHVFFFFLPSFISCKVM